MRMPLIIVDPTMWRRSPFQLFLLLLTLVAGIPIMLGVADNQVTEAMGSPYAFLWGLFLTIGSVFSLIGSLWPAAPETGMLIERTGLVALAGASFVWVVLVFSRIGWPAAYSGLLTLGFGIACAAQIFWIEKNINRIIQILEE